MKIGIISINAHTKVLNFASPLHSYAFQQFLKMHGYDSVIIDYKPNYYGQYNPRHPLFYQLSHPMKNKKKQRAALKKWLKLFIPRQIRFDKFQRFIDKYYITTDECYNENTLDTNDLGLDCYICATDVIWKCNKKAGFDRGFFLACDSMKGKYKIAYAASRGPVVELEEDKRKTFIEYISQFQNISIREKSFGEYIKRISGIETTHVLDPVLLHDKSFYEPIIQRPKRKKGYVLLYVVMESAIPLIELAVDFAKEHDLEVIELSENLADAKIPAGTRHKVVSRSGLVIWMKQSIFSPILSMQPVSPSYSISSFLSESVTATKFCLSWKCLDFRIVVLKTVLMDISALPTILILRRWKSCAKAM